MEQKQAVATGHQRLLGLLNKLQPLLAQDRIAQVIHRIIIRDAVVSHYTLESLVSWYMIIDKP